MMRSTRTAALVVVVGLFVAACGSGSDEADGQTNTVDVGYVPLPIFAPLFVADEKGYFEDEGLDVNLEVVTSGQDSIPLASSGKLDAVLAGFSAGMFSAIDAGLDVKVVGSMGVQPSHDQPSPSALIVSKELADSGDLTSVADLEGRSLGALGGEGATSAYYVSMALEQAGLSPEAVEFEQLDSPDIPTAIKSGSIAGGFVSAPFWNLAVDDGSATKLWTTPEGTSGTGVLYGGDFLDDEASQKFYDALARGAQDLQGDERYSQENLSIIGEYTDQTPEQVKSVPLYTWYTDLHPLPDQLADMEQFWLDVGALEYSEPLPPEEYVDDSYAESVKSGH